MSGSHIERLKQLVSCHSNLLNNFSRSFEAAFLALCFNFQGALLPGNVGVHQIRVYQDTVVPDEPDLSRRLNFIVEPTIECQAQAPPIMRWKGHQKGYVFQRDREERKENTYPFSWKNKQCVLFLQATVWHGSPSAWQVKEYKNSPSVTKTALASVPRRGRQGTTIGNNASTLHEEPQGTTWIILVPPHS